MSYLSRRSFIPVAAVSQLLDLGRAAIGDWITRGILEHVDREQISPGDLTRFPQQERFVTRASYLQARARRRHTHILR